MGKGGGERGANSHIAISQYGQEVGRRIPDLQKLIRDSEINR